MRLSTQPARQRRLLVAFACSIAIHALFLLTRMQEPQQLAPAPQRIEASLAARPPAPVAPPVTSQGEAPPRSVAKPPAKPRMMTAEKSRGPAVVAEPKKWTAAEREEMNRFLGELGGPARSTEPPTLAQRSLAMAREYGSEQARQEDTGTALLERRPNTPPPDQFSLDLYMDGLIRRLNRSASLVRNDPRSKGVQKAAVQFRINPDGSLKSFKVLNEGDQSEEIAFVRSVVERAIPFARFPPDIDRAARSLGVTICIQPSGRSGGFGFARIEGNSC
jgi:hypothetical protein